MVGPIDVKQNTSDGCLANCVTSNLRLSHDLDLWFSRSNFELAISQEWESQLTWYGRDANRSDVGSTTWLWAMTLTLDFLCQILKKPYPRNGMANWYGMKGMCVDRKSDPLCDFELWPHPGLDPGFSRSNFEKAVRQEWESRLTWKKRILGDRMLDPLCNLQLRPWPWTFNVKFWNCLAPWMEWLVTGEFPTQRPVTRSFDVFFDLHLNKQLSKQSCGWWFETPSCPLWRQCNV